MYIVPSDIFVSYKLVPEVRMSYKCATSRLRHSMIRTQDAKWSIWRRRTSMTLLSVHVVTSTVSRVTKSLEGGCNGIALQSGDSSAHR